MEGLKGEVRRVHVLYYLSHNGTIEQPHLIRVHHLHRNGVYLRDVKRWLADLRGKDMPDSFSWSYKRRYKSGYVWQDLVDDELITPLSDNEYVLKGSELSSKTNFLLDEISSKEEGAKQAPASKTSPESLHLEIDKSVSRKTLPEADHEYSPGAEPPPSLSSSDVSDDSAKRASIIKADIWKQQLELNKNEDTSFVSSIRNEPSSNNVHLRSGHRMSRLFHNLLRCQRVDTKDAALPTVQQLKRHRSVN